MEVIKNFFPAPQFFQNDIFYECCHLLTLFKLFRLDFSGKNFNKIGIIYDFAIYLLSNIVYSFDLFYFLFNI